MFIEVEIFGVSFDRGRSDLKDLAIRWIFEEREGREKNNILLEKSCHS